MKNIAVFASGSGSNAERITQYFKNSADARVKIILTNNPDAYVIQRAAALDIPVLVFNRNDFQVGENIIQTLASHQIHWLILAGFLWRIPPYLIDLYPSRIVNIHPALLPKFGGKGMYGARVHEAVISNKEETSGITIHFVNEHYDEGQIIFQAITPIEPDDTPDSLAAKIHELEYAHFPVVIEKLIKEQI